MSEGFLRNKTILITGAAGSIGSALARVIAKNKPKRLLLLDQDETGLFDLYEELGTICPVWYVITSIRERDAVDEVFKLWRPDIVYHAAAYKHVALMEEYPKEAHKTNVFGLANVLKSAREYKTKRFIFISSDKAVDPTSVMGETKALGEILCQGSHMKGLKVTVVRFGNVMPSRGSVVPIFKKQIEEGKNLTVTDRKMKRFFLGIYDAVNLLLEATKIGKGGETIVMDMGEPILIDALAKMMIKISGKPLSVSYTKPKKGEKYTEVLMTKQERQIARKVGNLYVIPWKKRTK